MNASNNIYKSLEQIEEEGLNIGKSDKYDQQILKYFDYDNRECYKLLNTTVSHPINIISV
jgi:hypothetical protein